MKAIVGWVLFLCLLCTVGLAESGQCGDNVWWELDDQGILTISGNGDMWEYGTPDDNTIKRPTYYSADDRITTINVQDGVTSIGSGAFREIGLKNISIPNSVISIGKYAFFSCSSLSSIEIPDSVTSIGNNAFFNCPALIYVPKIDCDGAKALSKANYSFRLPNQSYTLKYLFKHNEVIDLVWVYFKIPGDYK